MNNREEQRKIERQKKRDRVLKIQKIAQILASILAVMCIIAIIPQIEGWEHVLKEWGYFLGVCLIVSAFCDLLK